MDNRPSTQLGNAVDIYNKQENIHAEYAPSSAKRWCNCHASVKMSKDAGDSGANQYTAEGSLAHIICELCLKMVFTSMITLEELVGDTYMLDDFEIEVTEEMIEACWLYAETIAQDALDAGLTVDNIDSCLVIEQRVIITEECSGTSDCYLAIPFEKLFVYDFKYGAGVPVDVQDNYQMKCYAVGALNDYEYAHEFNRDPLDRHTSYMDVIELVIIQPRARHKDGFVRRWKTTRDEILKFKDEIQRCIFDCKEDNPTFKQGDWCRWCGGKHKCPQLFEETTTLAKKAFDAVDVGGDMLVAMTDEQMLELLDKKDTIIGFLKAVEAHAQARLESGDTIGTYKLVRGRATRGWAVPVEILQEQLCVSGLELYEKKLLTPTKLEKELKRATGVTLKVAKETVAQFVDPGVGKLSIAPGHDKREQVFLTAGEYFDEDLEL